MLLDRNYAVLAVTNVFSEGGDRAVTGFIADRVLSIIQ